MEEYNILNTVKPAFLRTKFPYNLVDPEKIVLTQKKITILVKELNSTMDATKQDPTAKKAKHGGGFIVHGITFYG